MRLNLTAERIELLRRLLEPVAAAPDTGDRRVATGLLFSIGVAERRAPAEGTAP